MSAASENAIVTFWIDEALFGLDVRDVQEVTPVLAITRVPGTSARIAGVVTWRGATIPVMDLHANVAQFQGIALREGRVLLLKKPEKLGLLIDRAEGVHTPQNFAGHEPWQLLDAAALCREEKGTA
ncbi:MAG TPA: chemotaxis protein CheW [bacterium]|nr:chemotaxis protein CheW [bacterium]